MKLVCWWIAVALGAAALIGAEIVWLVMLTPDVRWMTLAIGGVGWAAGYLGLYARRPRAKQRARYR